MSGFFGSGRRISGRGWRRSRLRLVGDLALTLVILGLLVLVVARLDDRNATRIGGRAVVADGDTLTVAGERIRLLGIDAPELDQRCQRDGMDYACGREARQALATLVGQHAVDCAGSERDRYGRLLADCRSGETDLGRALVEAGWAVAYGDYDREEDAAREARRGMWAGTFERPRDWRDRQGVAAEAEHARPTDILGWLRALLGFP